MEAYEFANGNFSGLTVIATNALSYPTFFTFFNTDEPISNNLDNVIIQGGNDAVTFSADQTFIQKYYHSQLISGFDLWASIGTGATLGYDTNSLFSARDCIFDINTSRSSQNALGFAHVFNVDWVPSIDIEDSKITISGGTAGFVDFGTNEGAGAGFVGVITNANLKLVDVIISVSGRSYAEGPQDFLSHWQQFSPNIFIQNVTWVSNGVPFRLPDTSPNISAMAEMQLSGIPNSYYWPTNLTEYLVVTNYSYTFVQNFTIGAAFGEMTNQFAGTYELSWFAELADFSSGGGAFKGALFTNGIQCTPLSQNNLDKNNGVASVVHLGDPIPTPVYLPAGTAIDLRINDSITNGWNMLIAGLKANRLAP